MLLDYGLGQHCARLNRSKPYAAGGGKRGLARLIQKTGVISQSKVGFTRFSFSSPRFASSNSQAQMQKSPHKAGFILHRIFQNLK
ncbi:hypothetical protein [Paraburkholderia sp. J11-2]|uniref:hypothetical protein n=1 Tax=Paraburkholderia sp. J11-2 TaxID=2805431 RepID=UPI002AB6123B|nr:hypothetical protein [Paraburkholderia sp. J11-2]